MASGVRWEDIAANPLYERGDNGYTVAASPSYCNGNNLNYIKIGYVTTNS